jgi:type I restriction enzyme S subunit
MSENCLINGWIEKTLPEICEIKTGKHDANHAVDDGKYRFYTCSNSYTYCDSVAFNGECIIVPGNGDIGLLFYYNGDFDAYQRTYVLLNIRINPKFLYYHMMFQWRTRNSDKQFGSTVRYVRMSNFLNYSLTIPSVIEQERIVAKIEELFSELDKGVAELQKIKAQLKVYRQAVLKDAFGVGENLKPISEIFEVSGGLTKNSKRNNLPKKMPYLRVANVYYNFLDLSVIKEIGVLESEIDRTLLKCNDLLFVEGNGSREQIGRVAIWNSEINNCLHQNHIIKARPNGIMMSKFALYYLMSKAGRGQILNVTSSTSGLYTLSINKVKNLKIPVCPIDHQLFIINEIESRLSICDKIELTVNESLQKAESLRQSILKKAFEGKLVPQEEV